MKRLIIISLILLFALSAIAYAAKLAPLHVLNIDGQIDPAVANYVEDGIKSAEDDGAQAVLIIMDTPGGLLISTKQILQSFYTSKIPVIVYVAPNGAWAASAGTFITMGADVAAMAPTTSIGAASPVNISPSGESQQTDKTMERKQINFAAKDARTIAEKKGRNADWAEKAVREAATLTAAEALKLNVIDYVAVSVPDLMRKIDGKQIKLESGKPVILHTRNAPLKENPMGPWDTFLHFLSNPLVALFLFMMAMYGLIYELSNPGAILPGVVGGIALLLLLYSFSVIPVNVVGFALIGFAIALFIIEFFTPTFGVLAVGGTISLFLGLMMLFRATEGFMVPIWILGAVAVVTGAFFIFVIGLGVKALKNPYIAGREGVVGHIGEARTDLDPSGHIFIDGALWTATSETGPIRKGEKVRVDEMDGLKLKVSKIEQDQSS